MAKVYQIMLSGALFVTLATGCISAEKYIDPAQDVRLESGGSVLWSTDAIVRERDLNFFGIKWTSQRTGPYRCDHAWQLAQNKFREIEENSVLKISSFDSSRGTKVKTWVSHGRLRQKRTDICSYQYIITRPLP